MKKSFDRSQDLIAENNIQDNNQDISFELISLQLQNGDLMHNTLDQLINNWLAKGIAKKHIFYNLFINYLKHENALIVADGLYEFLKSKKFKQNISENSAINDKTNEYIFNILEFIRDMYIQLQYDSKESLFDEDMLIQYIFKDQNILYKFLKSSESDHALMKFQNEYIFDLLPSIFKKINNKSHSIKNHIEKVTKIDEDYEILLEKTKNLIDENQRINSKIEDVFNKLDLFSDFSSAVKKEYDLKDFDLSIREVIRKKNSEILSLDEIEKSIKYISEGHKINNKFIHCLSKRDYSELVEYTYIGEDKKKMKGTKNLLIESKNELLNNIYNFSISQNHKIINSDFDSEIIEKSKKLIDEEMQRYSIQYINMILFDSDQLKEKWLESIEGDEVHLWHKKDKENPVFSLSKEYFIQILILKKLYPILYIMKIFHPLYEEFYHKLIDISDSNIKVILDKCNTKFKYYDSHLYEECMKKHLSILSKIIFDESLIVEDLVAANEINYFLASHYCSRDIAQIIFGYINDIYEKGEEIGNQKGDKLSKSEIYRIIYQNLRGSLEKDLLLRYLTQEDYEFVIEEKVPQEDLDTQTFIPEHPHLSITAEQENQPNDLE